jgi:WhiB family transcriptional regulator, redox-sensing transcriptional regulator
MTYTQPDPPSAYAIPPFAGRPDLGCREADPELFFPELRGGAAAEEAKAYCAPCPYREGPDGCLEWALDTNQRFGIWGGATPDERRRMRAKRDDLPATTPSCGTTAGYSAHLRDGTPTCPQCRGAHNAYVARRAAAAQDRENA